MRGDGPGRIIMAQAAATRAAMDLNADLGEGFGRWRLTDDEALLGVVTSANVACGFHAGDPATLVATCRAAAAGGVAVGAQVGYPDLAGFGRRFVDVDPDDPDQRARGDVAFGEIMDLAIALGGTITGEHGTGRMKKAWLPNQVGEDVMDISRKVKAALDPDGILNPGAMF